MPNDGNDRSIVRLVDETHAAITRLEPIVMDFDKMLRGSNGEPGLGEHVRSIESRVTALEQRIPENNHATTTRWQVVGHIAVAAVAVTAFLLQLWG